MKEFIFLLLLPLVTHGADFIESVHAQGAEIAKEMVVDGSQVVWSPFSVVNVLPLINFDESLKEGYKSSIQHLKDSEGVQYARINAAYVKDKEKAKAKLQSIAEDYGIEVFDFPKENNVKEVLSEKYKEEFGIDPPAGLLPESLENTTQLYLTSLLVRAEWEVPFKYSPKGRFYLNETHAVKARYMSNIGFYKYGEIEGVDGKILAVPLKNSSTTYFIVVLPDNPSGLNIVSQQFAGIQVSNITQKLKKKRTQLTLPKITVDSQLLLEPMPGVKIIQSGSLRFSYSGIDNRASKLRRSTTKFLRNRTNKLDLKFLVNRPFIYLIYDTQIGVLNYGEVLLPTDNSNIKVNYKSDSDKVLKLTQNAKSLSESSNELGNNLYQSLKTKFGSFAISPITLTHLLASYSTVANTETQQLFFSTLNSKSGILELNNNVYYLNATSANRTQITTTEVGELKEKVEELGTGVVAGDEETTTQGYYEYSYNVNLLFLKKYTRLFYKNERDTSNVTFYEYQGRVKYISLPFWDARAVLLYTSPTQSLLIFIPNERSGLHLVEDGLKDFAVSKLLCQMKDRFVRIRLPYFKVESELEILPSLREVYGTDILSFDGLNGAVLDSLTQKVNVNIVGNRVDQTRFRSKYQTRKKPSTKINVDRPFVFYLLDTTVGTLVNGRVVEIPRVQTVEQKKVVVPSVAPSVEVTEEIVTTVVPST